MSANPPMPQEVPVLIVGAGPVGLALANELGYRGIAYLLVDEGNGEVVFPAGEGIFSRTMEHLRRWGYSSEVRETSLFPADQPRNTIFATSFRGRELARFTGLSNRQEARSNPHSPEGGMFCPKMAFDPALRRGAERAGVGVLRYRTRLASFSQNEDCVHAEVVDLEEGTRYAVRARYLAAADGAHSAVRRTLNVNYVGSFAEGHNFAIHFQCEPLAREIHRLYGAPITQLHMLNEANRPYLVAVNGTDQWRLSMYIDPSDKPDPADTLRRIFGSELPMQVLRAQPWKGNRVVAERYRVDRVFLLGDAAHLRWPKGGFGANTGIGDAVDLGWKLWASLQGWGGDGLLDSYELERRPIAVRNVNEAANNRVFDEMIVATDLLDAAGVDGDAARQAIAHDLYAYRLREFRTAGIQLGYRYRNSPICIADGSLEPPDDHMLYSPSTWPGARAPHVWLSDARSTLDLFGPDFVLIRLDPAIDAANWVQAAKARGVPFRVVDLDGAAAAVRERYERSLVLVRPDGHVAWRADDNPADAAAILGKVTGHAGRSGFEVLNR
ncbi:MAG: FAD-dependent monooxygenase [Burkholderiaceae bacterium]